MRAWILLLCLIQRHLVHYGVDGKRYDPSMVDPLMRRSSLDKNFMRFGRSSPAYTEEDDVDDSVEYSSGRANNKEGNIQRSVRAKDNFIRFGRGRNDNFMRFGRGKQDNFMRFGRTRNDNFMRFGRGKQDSYMRFGRGKQDNYMRFGRGKQDNFIRFGRGKQDNFMRFGRDFDGLSNTPLVSVDNAKSLDPNILRVSRGKQNNFMRFGRNFIDDPDGNIPIAMRSAVSKSNSNFMRFGRAKQDSFIRFGKSENEKESPLLDEDLEEQADKPKETTNYAIPSNDGFLRDTKSKDFNLLRYGRHPPNKNDGFIRFGRNQQDQSEETSLTNELIPPRLKRSVLKSYGHFDDFYPSKSQGETEEHLLTPYVTLPDDLEEEYISSDHQDDYTTRRKRSLSYESSTPPPFTEEDSSVDYISAKLSFDSPVKPDYQTSLLSAGLPNVIVGPEFSLLPDLEPPTSMLKRAHPGDQNFLRLG